MATEQGTVESVRGDMALIRTHRSETCEGCKAKAGCMESGKEMEFRVKNTLNAKPGDQVQVFVSDSALLKAIFLVYMVPTLGLLAGAMAGQALAPALGLGPSVSAAIFGLGSMAGVFVFVRIVGNRMGKFERYRPRLAKIMTKTADDCPITPDNDEELT